MPGSANEGKKFTANVLRALAEATALRRIVDVGPGRGKYAALLRPILPEARFCGIEVWGPYVREFNLPNLYDEVVVADIRYLSWQKVAPVDVAIFGDVLEHMTEKEAQQVFRDMEAHVRYFVISIPVSHCHQEEIFGNPFEAHIKDDWTHAEVQAAFPNIVLAATGRRESDGLVIGVYIGAFRTDDAELLKVVAQKLFKTKAD